MRVNLLSQDSFVENVDPLFKSGASNSALRVDTLLSPRPINSIHGCTPANSDVPPPPPSLKITIYIYGCICTVAELDAFHAGSYAKLIFTNTLSGSAAISN